MKKPQPKSEPVYIPWVKTESKNPDSLGPYTPHIGKGEAARRRRAMERQAEKKSRKCEHEWAPEVDRELCIKCGIERHGQPES